MTGGPAPRILSARRVIVGVCQHCSLLVVVLNDGEAWPYVVCAACGEVVGATTEIRNRYRFDANGATGQVTVGRPPTDRERLSVLSQAVGRYIDYNESGKRPLRLWRNMCAAQNEAAEYLNTPTTDTTDSQGGA